MHLQYTNTAILVFLIFALSTCQNKSAQNQKNKDTITIKRAKINVPEVEEIPGMKDNERNRLEDVLPYYQSEGLYYSLGEALENPENVHRLRLRGMRLRELPLEIYQLKNLKELDLSDNSLSALPDSFASKFKRLEILDLSNNQFGKLPPQITQMPNLGYLNLRSNQLSQLPEDITALTQLQWLDLGRNQFKQLPEGITRLSNLKNLALDDAKIDSLPEAFKDMVRLRFLSLRRTGLSKIPQEIMALRELEELILAENKISELSPELSKLEKLSYLNVEKNRLTEVASLVGLPTLVNLNLSHNPITALPTNFFERLSSLKALNLSYTALSSLPSEISLCQGLVWLALQGNKINQLPEGISACSRLRVLFLGDNPEIDAEAYLGPLKGLDKLHTLRFAQIPGNAQKKVVLPAMLLELKSLVELDLRGNKLADAPAELVKLATLSNLQALNLSNSDIRQAHSEFKNFSSLKVLGLDLKNVSFSEVQKLAEILPPDAEVVDGTEFFSYKYWLD